MAYTECYKNCLNKVLDRKARGKDNEENCFKEVFKDVRRKMAMEALKQESKLSHKALPEQVFQRNTQTVNAVQIETQDNRASGKN